MFWNSIDGMYVLTEKQWLESSLNCYYQIDTIKWWQITMKTYGELECTFYSGHFVWSQNKWAWNHNSDHFYWLILFDNFTNGYSMFWWLFQIFSYLPPTLINQPPLITTSPFPNFPNSGLIMVPIWPLDYNYPLQSKATHN